MEEAPQNEKESSHSVHGYGVNKGMNATSPLRMNLLLHVKYFAGLNVLKRSGTYVHLNAH
jgi:hypothetical protein